VWLSVWSEVQTVYICSSLCQCIRPTPSSLASFKSRLVLPFWYRLTQVVLKKRPTGVVVVVVLCNFYGRTMSSCIIWLTFTIALCQLLAGWCHCSLERIQSLVAYFRPIVSPILCSKTFVYLASRTFKDIRLSPCCLIHVRDSVCDEVFFICSITCFHFCRLNSSLSSSRARRRQSLQNGESLYARACFAYCNDTVVACLSSAVFRRYAFSNLSYKLILQSQNVYALPFCATGSHRRNHSVDPWDASPPTSDIVGTD